jgi:hypothetical protein
MTVARLAHARARPVVVALALACGGCAVKAPPSAPLPPQPPPLQLAPVVGLAPAAGLEWVVAAAPRALTSRSELIPAIHALVPEGRFATFAAKNGGIDLRFLEELTVARYPETILYLARAPLDPARVEAAFAAQIGTADGRAIDRDGRAQDRIVRAWSDAAHEQIALFGVSAVGFERGRFGPLRAAELFAQGRLKRASPALDAVPLARAAELAGDAPLRAFAPGPFRGEWARGLGGLVGAATAVAIAVRPPSTPPAAATARPLAPLTVSLFVLGAWNDKAPAAAERLAAAYGAISESTLGHLCGIDHPLTPPRTRAEPDHVALDVTIDALAIARGMHRAMAAQIDEIMDFKWQEVVPKPAPLPPPADPSPLTPAP